MNNPYQAPASDIRLANSSQPDTSSPLSTKGRFSRLSYIAWICLAGIVSQILVSLAFFGLIDYSNPMLSGLVTLIVQLPAMALHVIFTIRRCHDINKGGWWAALFILPLINFYLWFTRGNEAENNFGSPRPTTTFEQVIAYLFISLCILGIIGIVIALTVYRQQLGF